MYCVYILLCSDNKYYCGVTSNLEKRLFEHQNGLIPNSFTSNRRPVKLVFSQEFSDKLQAIEAEKQIKKWSRKKKEALINGDFSLLKKYAECQNNTHYKFKN